MRSPLLAPILCASLLGPALLASCGAEDVAPARLGLRDKTKAGRR